MAAGSASVVIPVHRRMGVTKVSARSRTATALQAQRVDQRHADPSAIGTVVLCRNSVSLGKSSQAGASWPDSSRLRTSENQFVKNDKVDTNRGIAYL